MKTTIAAIAIAIAISSTAACAEMKCDYSGNCYSVNTYGNNAHVQGWNSNGNSWNTNIDRKGNMNGVDSDYNTWNYNSQTGTYWNSNGTMCFGHGTTRICN